MKWTHNSRTNKCPVILQEKLNCFCISLEQYNIDKIFLGLVLIQCCCKYTGRFLHFTTLIDPQQNRWICGEGWKYLWHSDLHTSPDRFHRTDLISRPAAFSAPISQHSTSQHSTSHQHHSLCPLLCYWTDYTPKTHYKTCLLLLIQDCNITNVQSCCIHFSHRIFTICTYDE